MVADHGAGALVNMIMMAPGNDAAFVTMGAVPLVLGAMRLHSDPYDGPVQMGLSFLLMAGSFPKTRPR